MKELINNFNNMDGLILNDGDGRGDVIITKELLIKLLSM